MLFGLALWMPIRAWPLIGAPFVEEVIFRVGLQSWLMAQLAAHPRTRRLTPAWQAVLAITATAVAFSLAHVARHPGAWSALTFLPALLLGGIYQSHRRLTHCVLLHAGFNGIWLLVQPFVASFELSHPWMF